MSCAGQQPGDGLLIQHGDLLKPQPRELRVTDILLSGMQSADAPIRQIHLHGVTTVCHCLEGAVADVVALFA